MSISLGDHHHERFDEHRELLTVCLRFARERRRHLVEVSNRLSLENPGNGGGPGSAEGRMTAVTACRTCGTEPLENARFCHGCVEDADTHAEYKQVTVLFADVVIRLGVTN